MKRYLASSILALILLCGSIFADETQNTQWNPFTNQPDYVRSIEEIIGLIFLDGVTAGGTDYNTTYTLLKSQTFGSYSANITYRVSGSYGTYDTDLMLCGDIGIHKYFGAWGSSLRFGSYSIIEGPADPSEPLTIYGNRYAGGGLVLASAHNATKGKVYFGVAHTNYYDEANNTWNLGTAPLTTDGDISVTDGWISARQSSDGGGVMVGDFPAGGGTRPSGTISIVRMHDVGIFGYDVANLYIDGTPEAATLYFSMLGIINVNFGGSNLTNIGDVSAATYHVGAVAGVDMASGTPKGVTVSKGIITAATSVTPVVDGTYTVGKGAVTDGTITVSGGIITAVQQASN
ncbi:MAG: hypothetical protein WC738_04350 [Candidatus Omnitrophota bacterium]|jgi:hypothetical protein